MDTYENTSIPNDQPKTDDTVLVPVAGQPEVGEDHTGDFDNVDGGEVVTIPPGEVEKTTKPKIEHRILIIHDDDQDGYCAANIIRMHKKQPTVAVGLFAYQHGRDLRSVVIDVDKWDEIFVVDLATPLTWIRDLLANGFKVTVVDHHASTINALEDFADENFCAYVGTAFSAAGLAWRYCHGEDKEAPWAVKMINDWDTWNHEDPQVIPFHYGMGCVDKDNQRVWDVILKGDPNVCNQIMQMGALIGTHWVTKMNEFTASQGYALDKHGLKFYCCNGNFKSSYDFAGVPNAETYDAFMWYKYTPHGWKVSMRSTKVGVNLLPIVEQYGGAGHEQSCGALLTTTQIKEWLLPSEQDNNTDNNVSSENN